MMPLLTVNDLVVNIPLTRNAWGRVTRQVHAVRGVALTMPRGSTLGLVGESGSGKSTVAGAIAGLVRITEGEILFCGAPLDRRERHRLRGRISIVFQDPRSSLNPRMRVGRLVAEPLSILGVNAKRQRERVEVLMGEVGLTGDYAGRFPHELSGGQRQRVAIARAIASDPDLLILDEPTSALDVSVQAQVLDLLLRLQATRKVGYLFISHDIGVVRHMSDEVAVMRAGQIVESGPARDVLENPQQAYTQALLNAVPRIAHGRTSSRRRPNDA